MKWNKLSALLFSSLLSSLPVQAVTVYKCIDSEGNTVFMDRCPPGTEQVARKELKGDKKKQGPDLKALAAGAPIKFYMVPDCDSCDLVRVYLENRGFPYSENNVVDSIELQDELKEKSGALTVPVVTIGDDVIKGYNKPVLDSALLNAGYPPETEDAN